MKTFVKDYVELCKMAVAFNKNHWKGIVVLNIVGGVATYVYICKDTIKDKLESKFHKEEESN